MEAKVCLYITSNLLMEEEQVAKMTCKTRCKKQEVDMWERIRVVR